MTSKGVPRIPDAFSPTSFLREFTGIGGGKKGAPAPKNAQADRKANDAARKKWLKDYNVDFARRTRTPTNIAANEAIAQAIVARKLNRNPLQDTMLPRLLSLQQRLGG